MRHRTHHPRTFCALGGLLLMLGALLPASVRADTTRVAVAANFAAPMAELIREFEQRSDHTATVSLGSSGQLFAQVQNGAPYDLFLSADSSKPDALIAAGLADGATRFTYAIGTLALLASDGGDALSQLQQRRFRHLAIANPKLAPYGAAATEVLEELQLQAQSEKKLVMAENIAQAHQFVSSGNAELGFVALSQVMTEGKVAPGVWIVPTELHTPIRQDAVLLKRGDNNAATRALLDYLHSDEAKRIIRAYGYQTP